MENAAGNVSEPSWKDERTVPDGAWKITAVRSSASSATAPFPTGTTV